MLLEWFPDRQILGDWELKNHDEIGAFACALTALAFAAGRCVAVGSRDDGFMILPPLELWGYDAARKWRWAERELRRNLAEVCRAGGVFPRATVYRDASQWLPAAESIASSILS